MTKPRAVTLLVISIAAWAAGVAVYLFADSWWRLPGLLAMTVCIPLATVAGRALRKDQD
ncbi:hypothetical protein [Microbacterium sp.]|uniref:hypothetical protein n=1 Tax=Microbacterium sp. TaxID=51671 RepID=UPI0028114C9F|nr:hypothetical protein [Microbacterium sp.]